MEIICHYELLILFLNILSNKVDSQEVIRNNARMMIFNMHSDKEKGFNVTENGFI